MLSSTKTRATLVIAASVLAAAMTTAGGAAAAAPHGATAGTTAARVARPSAVRPYLDPNGYPRPNVGATTYISADGYGYYEGECTSRRLGRAQRRLRRTAVRPTTSATPRPGTPPPPSPPRIVGDVAQADANHNGAGSTGHVAYVSAAGLRRRHDPGAGVQLALGHKNNYTGHRYNTRQISASTPSRYLKP